MNSLLEARFRELQDLQQRRSDLNEKLGVKIAAYGGGGVALAAGLVALTGGLGLLVPAAIASAQLAKGGFHGVRAGVQSHQQKVRELDQLISEKTRLIVRDLSQQLSSGTVSRDDGVAAYYRLKYMDSGMDRELDELARKLGVS